MNRRTRLSVALGLMLTGAAMVTAPILKAGWSEDALQARADAGEAAAQRELGEAYLSGKNVPRDTDRGLILLGQAADQNDALAHYALYQHYQSLVSTPNVDQLEREHLRRAAAGGHTTAMTKLGQLYLDRSRSRDLTEADAAQAKKIGVELIRRAADAGNPAAGNLMGDFYVRGVHVERNQAQAITYFERANDAAAHWRLAQYFLTEGDAGEKHRDLERGLVHLHEAGNRGHADALLQLVSRYDRGQDVPQDLEVAIQWAKFAVESKVAQASQHLNRLQARQQSEQVREREIAAASAPAVPAQTAPLAAAPAPTSTPAVTAPAMPTRRPEAAPAPVPAPAIVPSAANPPARVVATTEVSASAGPEASLTFSAAPTVEQLTAQLDELTRKNTDLTRQVGELRRQLEQNQKTIIALTDERDRARDVVQALESALAAARRSTPVPAQPSVGPKPAAEPLDPARLTRTDPVELNRQAMVAYQRKDFAAAVKFFRQAANAGSPAADNNLGMMLMRGEGAPANPAEAINHFERAANKGSGAAAQNLAHIYHYGRSVPVNLDTALTWYQRAKSLGNGEAQAQIEAINRSRQITIALGG